MKKNNTSLYLAAIFAVALLVGVGYAALSATLKINGQTTINKASWDVHFEDITTNDTSAIKFYKSDDAYLSQPLTSITNTSSTTFSYKMNLSAPDPTMDTTHDITAKIVNKGTIDAKVSSASLPTGSSFTPVSPANAYSISMFVTVNCSYSDGTLIKTGDVIKAGASKTITCKHHYKSPSELTTEALSAWTSISSTNMTGSLSLTLNFYAQ